MWFLNNVDSAKGPEAASKIVDVGKAKTVKEVGEASKVAAVGDSGNFPQEDDLDDMVETKEDCCHPVQFEKFGKF